MHIKSFIASSLIDYDGKISSVIFLPGCNYKCPFCHNKQLVLEPETLSTIHSREILDYLKGRQSWIDAVVISGGEPTIHKDLGELCEKIKDLGYLVKIDTNGSKPEVLERLIQNNLVDYIAMDIKTAIEPERYSQATGTETDLGKIKASIDIVKNLEDYEFRVTCVPCFVKKEDLINIAQYLKSVTANKSFFLQQFHAENLVDPALETMKPYSKEEMEQFRHRIEPYFQKVGLRGVRD
ncbi:MAG: anaerobic ribonucleoside-triphosphate reductase activating protein [Candidatus Pacearchaeota archaeon]|nr:anaerobic ribonucleoside-triphosphate reductase activating protein [Candidatus Pacearchaeota archaeon]